MPCPKFAYYQSHDDLLFALILDGFDTIDNRINPYSISLFIIL